MTAGDVRLLAHFARPAPSAARGQLQRALVLCPDFPSGSHGAAAAAATFPELAERVAADTGWVAVAVALRGTGGSEGDFSLHGWMDDVRAVVSHVLAEEPVTGGVWLAGFGTGGAVCICVAADDERVKGVAALGAPADFSAWAGDLQGFVAHAREIGAIRTAGYPHDHDAWSREIRETKPIDAIGRIPPRPVLLVHGIADDFVPAHDARALAEAAAGEADLRLIIGAGHHLRHDPRAVAVLLGWLSRQ